MSLLMKRNVTILLIAFLGPGPFSAIAQAFLQVDFAGGALPDGWNSLDLSGNGVNWQACPGPGSCGLENLPAVLANFGSSTAANGFAAVNSDAAGILPNAGHISRLSSPPIDCSGRSRVFLQFQTAIGTFTRNAADNATLRVISNAGNRAYHPFSMLEKSQKLQLAPVEELAGGKAYYVTLDISEIAAGQPQLRLEWEWRGNYEFAWLIDDILLSAENPARPANAAYFEPFTGGSNGWTANAITADSLWKWTPAGDVGKGIGLAIADRDGFIHSLTASDGAMVFDADLYNTRGLPPPDGFTPKAFVCELVSPPIDLSGADQPLALQFTQLGWLGNLANGAPQTQEGARFITSFAYSTDGGGSWSEPVNVNPYQTPGTSFNIGALTAFNNTVYFALPDVEGNGAFRIKFTWAADFFFWALDDIALVERAGRDMKANRNFFAILPNAITPASQLQDETLLCDIVNIGRETCEEVRLEAFIRKKDNGRIAYADTLSFGAIPVDSLVENVFFNRKVEAAALAETGEYEAFYAVKHNQPDGRPEDDTVRWRFQVSHQTFAKEFGPTRDVAPSDGPSYSYGNVFYVPKGEGFYACQVSFGIANTAQLSSFGEEAFVFLYEWDGDLNGDGMANPEEYRSKAVNSHTFSSTDGTDLITIPISFQGDGVELQDDTYYILVVQYDSSVLDCYMQASDTIDYQATWFVNDSLGRQQYASILDVGNTGTFSTIGFGYNIVPVVRMHIGTGQDCILMAANELKGATPLFLAPNPARDWVKLYLDDSRIYTNAALTITDLSGRVALTQAPGRLQQGALQVDVSRLPAGMYGVRLVADGVVGVGKLVVER